MSSSGGGGVIATRDKLPTYHVDWGYPTTNIVTRSFCESYCIVNYNDTF